MSDPRIIACVIALVLIVGAIALWCIAEDRDTRRWRAARAKADVDYWQRHADGVERRADDIRRVRDSLPERWPKSPGGWGKDWDAT